MEQNLAIGVDIGGSHITCAAVDLVSFRILRETLTEREVDNKAPADDIIGVWSLAISDIITQIPENSLKAELDSECLAD
jgi:glucokinase